jgi:PIN domain nuclease of toxin-antitoxin system
VRLLLDTSVLLFWVTDGDRLSHKARDAIQTADSVLVSAVTAMELSTKLRIGKLDQARLLVDGYAAHIEAEGFEHLPLDPRHALLAGQLDAPDRDPFDRMLAAQARLDRLTLVSPDTAFDRLGARRLW